jgi:vancomycin resistance protein YoaR
MKPILVLIISLALNGCFSNQQPLQKPLSVSPAGVTVAGASVGGLTLDQLQVALTELAKTQNSFPQNAAFDSEGKIISEKPGQVLDIQATAERVNTAQPHSSVQAIYQQISPPITGDTLAAAKRIGGYETPIIDAHPDRVNNIALTASLLNNTIIDHGQEFSFNRLTGEPTVERGFRHAGVLENGRKVQGVGGGMCQVSSTVYNAALMAGLKITERHPHSQPVSYVPAGRDATTFTDKDLRFMNSTRHPLILRVFIAGKMVKADIFSLPQ